MQRFILFTVFLTFLSCNNSSKSIKENAKDQINKPKVINALPIEKHATIPVDTTFGKKLSTKEMLSTFTIGRQNQLGISNTPYQAYTYKDASNEYYLLLTDHQKGIDTETKDTLYDNIYGVYVTRKNNQFKKRSSIIDDIDKDWEVSIGFWNQYSQLSDLDGDGIVDPIIVYGTTAQNAYQDGRVRIVAYHMKKRSTIKHQNSEIADGRITKISKKFYNFPIQIQEAVKETMKLMTENGHAVYAEGWEEMMNNSATRLE